MATAEVSLDLFLFLLTAATREGSIIVVVVVVVCSDVRSAAGQQAESAHVPHVRGSGERHHRAAVAGAHQRVPAETQAVPSQVRRSPDRLLLGAVCRTLLR